MNELRERYLALVASHGPGALHTPAGRGLAADIVGAGSCEERGGWVFASPASLGALWDLEDAVAFGARNLLVVGERGVGKEAVARVAGQALGLEVTSVNCATLVESLADAELFGVGGESGLPGVPRAGKRGYVGEAHGGVLFLDEIFDAPYVFPKLLRLLENRVYSRVAEATTRPFEGVVVAASNRFPTRRDLEAATGKGAVRADLVDRFVVVEVPPLRARRAEIPALANRFLRGLASEKRGCSFERLDEATAAVLRTHPYAWPGNLRELFRFVREQARLRRHGGGASLHVPVEDVRRLLPLERPEEVGGLSAWERDGLRDLRRAQLLAALAEAMADEGRSAVGPNWVGQRVRELLGVQNVSEKLRSGAGTSCAELAAMLG